MTTTPTMLAILIDPTARTVEPVTLDTTNTTLGALYHTIGCERVDVVRLSSGGLDMWIADDGLDDDADLFLIPGLPQPYAGRAVILRSDREGNTIGLTGEYEQERILGLIRQHVLFPVFAAQH
jgi:hypothetical protein